MHVLNVNLGLSQNYHEKSVMILEIAALPTMLHCLNVSDRI